MVIGDVCYNRRGRAVKGGGKEFPVSHSEAEEVANWNAMVALAFCVLSIANVFT